jgi:hypothetical protein
MNMGRVGRPGAALLERGGSGAGAEPSLRFSRSDRNNFAAVLLLKRVFAEEPPAVREHFGALIALSVLVVIAFAGIGNLYAGWL